MLHAVDSFPHFQSFVYPTEQRKFISNAFESTIELEIESEINYLFIYRRNENSRRQREILTETHLASSALSWTISQDVCNF